MHNTHKNYFFFNSPAAMKISQTCPQSSTIALYPYHSLVTAKSNTNIRHWLIEKYVPQLWLLPMHGPLHPLSCQQQKKSGRQEES